MHSLSRINDISRAPRRARRVRTPDGTLNDHARFPMGSALAHIRRGRRDDEHAVQRPVLADRPGAEHARPRPPRGLVIRPGKENGFTAGADIDEFTDVTNASAIAVTARGWDAFDQIAHSRSRRSPSSAGSAWAAARARSPAVPRRRRRSETRLAPSRGDYRVVPGCGGATAPAADHRAAAALDLLLTGREVDGRRAKKPDADDALRRGATSRTRCARRPRTPPARTGRRSRPPSPTESSCTARRRDVAEEGGQTARHEHYPAPYAIIDLSMKHFSDTCAASPPGHLDAACSARPTTTQPRPALPPAGAAEGSRQGGRVEAAHVHVVGAGTMGGDIAAWCGVRGRRHAAGPGRAAPRAGDTAAATLFTNRLRIRAACASLRPPHPGRGGRRGREGGRDHRGHRRERGDQAHAVRGARAQGEGRGDTRVEHVEHPARGDRDVLRDPERLIGLHFFNPVGADDAGRDRRGPADARSAGDAGGRLRRARSTSCRCPEERARVPREPHPLAVPDGGDAHASTKASRRRRSTRRRSRSACRWGRSSSPTPWGSTSASRSAG